MLHNFLFEGRIHDHSIELIVLLCWNPVVFSAVPIFAFIVTSKSIDLVLFLFLVLLPSKLNGSFLLLFHAFLFVHEPFGLDWIFVKRVAVLLRRVKHRFASLGILRFIDLS